MVEIRRVVGPETERPEAEHRVAERPEADRPVAPGLVWYAAYGSNMHAERLNVYLRGGRPTGGARSCPGARDRRPPRRSVPVVLPGVLYFASLSLMWTGGSGFYDPGADGEMPARAYLLTAEQFGDIAQQEMRRYPLEDLDLSPVLATGRQRLGSGRYETLVCPGRLDGLPVLTFTASWSPAEAVLNAPSAAYLRNLASGLAEAHGWGPGRAADYLSTRPGAAGHWTADAVRRALDGAGPAG
ncbi:histone deacetylase [Kitasatospora sp. NPDC090091]|uniref:histone deacetylase n=1 Tax=Kitasatospora sp. NPDC090091 TaxID=3364081 RepID=UPI00380D2227